jgi:isocitrate lyase
MSRHNGNEVSELKGGWTADSRWKGIRRDYQPEAVLALRPSLKIQHTLAKHTAERLWRSLNSEPWIGALGALTGSQAVQMVKGGLQSIYLS